MADYTGVTTSMPGAGNKQTSYKTGVNDLVTFSSYRQHNHDGARDAQLSVGGTKGTKHKGLTPTSPVYVIDVMTIIGPRNFPLEISWKKAETGN